MSSNAKVTYSEGKVYPSDDGSQPRCELYLDELTLGATGVITVMVYRSWDVHTLTGCYASTYFVIEDEVSLSKTAVHTDYSQATEGTFPLELYVSEQTTSTVVVMFDEPAKELLKCSADSLAAADDESSFGYTNHASLPLALANIIGTTHTLKMKSHTYYEHGTFESFSCWRIAPEEVVKVDSESRNTNTSAEVNITKVKRRVTRPSVANPSKPTEERGKRDPISFTFSRRKLGYLPVGIHLLSIALWYY
nr:hypothetical protein [Tanacetum cinerariifolium]